ncbi:hypothetical protein FNV43_RR03883 [Rhamnella rubrinervis]|uniref:RNase H type-1 domain-containing protein n=1 Tax=Rhamnella rubrinervis TaxID=2594499 RepID=A0A8K0MPQ4_9ROSA|nr:hypothetical protein FNV43_RR03883 [Rhamnella rubrinervis]
MHLSHFPTFTPFHHLLTVLNVILIGMFLSQTFLSFQPVDYELTVRLDLQVWKKAEPAPTTTDDKEKIYWESPDKGLKINVDAGFVTTKEHPLHQHAACAAVVRDVEGDFLMAKIKNLNFIGAKGIAYAEAQALILALKIAKENNYTDLEIETDSQLIIDWLERKKSLRKKHPYKDDIEHCKQVVKGSKSWKVRKVHRDANDLADAFARRAFDTDCETFYSIPEETKELGKEDETEELEKELKPPKLKLILRKTRKTDTEKEKRKLQEKEDQAS